MKTFLILLIFILLSNLAAVASIPSREELIERCKVRQEILRREYRANPLKLIRDGRLKIKDKDGNYSKFVLNPIQTKLLDQIEKDWNEGRPIRYLILKARQEGVSTLLEAVVYVLTAFQDNQNALILADDLKGSNYLFDMSKLYHQSIIEKYPLIVPSLEKSNEKGLKFEDNRSQIVIETGDNKEAGRKYTFRIVHVSEAAFIEYIDTIMTGLLQAVPQRPQTIVILETTGNGVGGYFPEQWNNPENEYTVWRKIFFGWFENSEYSLPFTQQGEAKRLKQTLGKDPRFNEFEGEEQELIDRFHCNLEQINWRRWAIVNNCGGSLDNFHQEYPAFPEQAFLLSGRPVFNLKILQKMRMKAPEKPIQTGYLVYDQEKPLKEAKIEFQYNPGGYLRIYEEPQENMTYAIGGDAMKGKIKNETKKEPDKASLTVMNVKTLNQAAVWEGRIDADLLGVEAVKLARYYKDAFIGIEINDGVATVARIKNEGYWNVYQKTVYDQVIDKQLMQLGWWTDTKSKLLMIGDLQKFIREWLGEIRDKETIKELMQYVYDDEGRTNAQTGCHDDHVISLAICYQMCKAYYAMPEHKIKPEEIKGSFGWWEKLYEKMDQPKRVI